MHDLSHASSKVIHWITCGSQRAWGWGYITDQHLCLCATELGYLVEHGKSSGPLFKFADGRCLTRNCFVSFLRSALAECGIDSSLYAGHSFCIGAATTPAFCGLQDSLIKTLGRWYSSAYTVYIRTPRASLISVAKSLVTPSDWICHVYCVI